jgi:pimeloyl-ACP methyl ester carboxylesterase
MPAPAPPIVPPMRIPTELASLAATVMLPRYGREVFCYDAGPRDAPGVLLVHGLGDEADTWRRVIEPLSERYRVVAPDLPGFGRSPAARHARLSPPYLGAVLGELLEHLRMRGVTLVGSSLGAALAQVVALSDPGLVSRLVLVDGGLLAMGRPTSALLLMLVPGVGERRYRSFAADLDAAYASLTPYYADLEALPAEERQFLRERVGERVTSESQMRAYFSSFRGFTTWMLARGRMAARKAAALDIPTTYIWGSEDHIIPLEAAKAAHAKHEGSTLIVIPGAGHLPHQETPKGFLEASGLLFQDRP